MASRLIVALLLSITIMGCGGGGQAPSSTTASSAAASHVGGTATVLSGPVRASLQGENHAPVEGRNWGYTVRAADAAGRPLSGTVEIEYVFGGQVVGRNKPRFHPVRRGRWHDLLVFPPASVGQPLTFRAVVHTALVTVTLDWPIRVSGRSA